ncbi:MAG: hypothetical protein P0Y62_01060 [Candidatus Chryseobacterium colombiense]|nr:hypothetical protein [Chryseobacterium sp.]WEK70143.1 MAG: hypothetical protein P0Y62_01060 [Chryseobacterium sp.]
MKILIFIVSLVLIFVFYNYPVFNSTGITYIIILTCLIIISFAGAKLYTSDIKEDYESVEKEMNELHFRDGDFQYKNDGFYTKNEFIKWDEIIEVNSFSIPVLHRQHQTGIEIITDKKHYEFNDENISGIEKLTDKLYENFPNWETNPTLITVNNHGLKKATLYKRDKI